MGVVEPALVTVGLIRGQSSGDRFAGDGASPVEVRAVAGRAGHGLGQLDRSRRAGAGLLARQALVGACTSFLSPPSCAPPHDQAVRGIPRADRQGVQICARRHDHGPLKTQKQEILLAADDDVQIAQHRRVQDRLVTRVGAGTVKSASVGDRGAAIDQGPRRRKPGEDQTGHEPRCERCSEAPDEEVCEGDRE